MNYATPKERLCRYIALEDVDLEFTVAEVKKIIGFWYDGLSVVGMASLVKRTEVEVLLLLVALSQSTKLVLDRTKGISSSKPLEHTKSTINSLTMVLRKAKEEGMYIAFLKYDLVFESKDIQKAYEILAESDDIPIYKIAKKIKRNTLETLLLLCDMALYENLPKRREVHECITAYKSFKKG